MAGPPTSGGQIPVRKATRIRPYRRQALQIVHVIARLNVGGAALHVMELAAEQRRLGHDVLVVAGTLAEGEESMEYRAEELGLPLLRMPELQRELSLRRDSTAVRKLRRVLAERRPDVLHTHTAKAGATGRSPRSSVRARPRALVHTFHGHVLTGYFGERRSRVYAAAERMLARRTGAVIAVSDQVRDDLVRLGVAPRERFVVIPYGFDLDRGRPGPRPGADRRRRGVRGRLGRPAHRDQAAARRRPALARCATAATRAVHGRRRRGPRRRPRRSPASSRCDARLVGFREGLADWYAGFDALALTSENEGTPVAAIEALAARRPVVATRVGGVPAVVTHGEDGFLVAGRRRRGARRTARRAGRRSGAARRGWARTAPSGCARSTPWPAWSAQVEALYDRLLAR